MTRAAFAALKHMQSADVRRHDPVSRRSWPHLCSPANSRAKKSLAYDDPEGPEMRWTQPGSWGTPQLVVSKSSTSHVAPKAPPYFGTALRKTKHHGPIDEISDGKGLPGHKNVFPGPILLRAWVSPTG